MNQPLDTRQLRAFATLARTGSFTLAAKELYLSQSAVRHSMKALEGDVGCRLLDRLGKKVLLTQAGEQLLQHAQKILQEMESAREMLRRLGKQMVLNSVIEIGSMEATKELGRLGLGVSILAPWITREEIEDGSLVALPLGRRKLQRRWGILHWRGKRLNLAEERFIGLCESATILLRNQPCEA